MARGSLPESLELLLDTMCNTFGGVMFITISMVITLMICQQRLTPEKQLEEEKKRLEACRKENLALNERRAREERRLAELEKLARKNAGEKDSGLAAAVAGLERELRKTKRECDTIDSELKLAAERIGRLGRDNRERERANLEKRRELEKRKALLEDENRRLAQELAALRGTLAATPVKKIVFSRNERTSSSPYVMLVKDDNLYCVGAAPPESSERATVSREGNILRMFPGRGVPLASLSRENFSKNCPGFRADEHFLWIIVDADSMASFVHFRRLVRSCGCRVFWYVKNRFIIYFGQADYSAGR